MTVVPADSARPPSALAGGGAMGRLIRAHDWAATPLGAPEGWSPSLMAAVSICLHSSFPTAIYWGPELRLIYNDAWAPIPAERHPWALGRPAEEVWSDIWLVVEPQMRQVMETGEGFATFDQMLPMVRGGRTQETYWNYSFTPIRDGAGQVGGIFNQGHEVTERVVRGRRDRFLFDLGDRLRTLSDPGEIIATAQEALGRYLGANRAGYGEVDDTARWLTTGRNWTDDRGPAREGVWDLTGFGSAVIAALRAGQPVVIEDVLLDRRTQAPGVVDAYRQIEVRSVVAVPLVKNGRLRAALYVHSREPRPWGNEDAELVAEVAERTWSAVERARAENEAETSHARLRESEARFRNMADNAPVMMWVTDADGRCVYLNRLWHEFTGQTAEEAAGLGWLDATHPEDRARTGKAFATANAAREAFRLEYRLRRADGAYRWAIDAASPRFDAEGVFMGYVGSVIDIQDKHESEIALRMERDRAQGYLDIAEVMILVLDTQGRVRTVNRAGTAMLGHSDAAALLGRDWFDLAVPPGQRAEVRSVFARLVGGAAGDTDAHEHAILRADGQQRLISWRNLLLRDEDGTVTGTLSSGHDVTDQRLAQERERLLAQEIDHRAKNLLAVVQSVVQLTRADDIQAFKAAITGRIQSLARTHGLLAAARWEGADLGQLVADEMAPYARDDPGRVTVHGAPLHLAPAAAQALALVVHELATNAAKHGALSARDGRVRIAWDHGHGSEARFRLRWAEIGGPPVVEPTRRGFGSVVLRSSVERQLRGQVRLEWRPAGLLCDLEMPLTAVIAAAGRGAGARRVDERPEDAAATTAAALRLLVLEDEPLVAAQMEQVLTAAGHEVVSAFSLSEALSLVLREPLDAALLDINLGGERSYPLAELLRARRIPFAFCSGYGETADLPRELEAAAVIAKPFDPSELLAGIARLR
ncbi:MAG: PAS domain S-box protein [Acetobacteraceae bacterium]|nr:PAS domain S-box protein [Acetobacteraceae bacterium]